MCPISHWFSFILRWRRPAALFLIGVFASHAIASVDQEVEPNDTASVATPIGGSLRIHGQISESDKDYFSFETTGAPQRWLIEAEGKSIYSLQFHEPGATHVVYASAGSDPTKLSNLYLLPGRHSLSISGGGASALYEIRLTSLGPPDLHDEREPNNDSTRAESLREADFRQGTLGDPADVDHFRFSTAVPEPVSLRLVPAPGSSLGLGLVDDADREIRRWDPEGPARELIASLVVPAGDYGVIVRSSGPVSSGTYRLYFERKNRFFDPEHEAPELPGISFRLQAPSAAFAACRDSAQSQEVALGLKNDSDAEQTLELEATSNEPHGSAAIQPAKIVLAPGSEAQALLALSVPPDLSATGRLQVSLRAKRPDGAQALSTISVAADCDAEPLNPTISAPLPESLLGRMDVAWAALGASVVLEGLPEAERNAAGTRLAELFDGVTPNGGGVELKDSDRPLLGEPFAVTVRLAGEPAPLVEGLLLHPQCALPSSEQLKDFSLLLSDDGAAFDEVLSGSLDRLREEQHFPLAKPRNARYARLLLRSNQSGQAAPIGLGEWKVLSSTETRSLGTGPLNIADPARGGYVVFSDPLIPSEPYSPLTEAMDGVGVPVEGGTAASFTIGFLHDRAARVEGIEWVSGAVTSGQTPPSLVAVETAVDSPIGPWEPLGRWALEPGADHKTVFTLPSPRWARYVRFAATLDAPAAQAGLPRVVRVFEQPADAEYRSILGEWGHYARASIFERLVPPEPLPPVQERGNTSREQALLLAAGQVLGEELRLLAAEQGHKPASAERWYRVAVPEGHNLLEISLVARPQMPLAWTALDAAGNEVAVKVLQRSASSITLTAQVQPGAQTLFRVTLPPPSVVLAWDTSESIGRFLPNVYRALERFTSEVRSGREFVNLFPFRFRGGEFLLPQWSDDAFLLATALNDYDRAESSSEAERALLAATLALGKRSGTRAIVILTDAETASYEDTLTLWNAFTDVAPRVFTLDVHNRPGPFQHLMESWAGVAGGQYAYFRTQRDLDRGFERAACLLRRPLRYSIAASTRLEAPRQPGTLSVVAGSAAQLLRGPASSAQVELILDASGSMKRKLGGRTMMEAAKETLFEVIRTLPPESRVALRVYGHRIHEGQSGDCEDSELLQPLARLDPATLTGRIQAVQALGTTPIAYSLRQVAGDLDTAAGESLVVLVTDGEEECGGDPAEAIRFLLEKGIRMRLNVVGFNLGAPAGKGALAQAAASSQGAYFDAADAKGLELALQRAFAPAFSVFEEGGGQVAAGTVDGRELELAPGRYELRIEAEPGSFPFEIKEQSATVVRISRTGPGLEAQVVEAK